MKKISWAGLFVILIVLVLIVHSFFKSHHRRDLIENFDNKNVTFHNGDDIYDAFYADIYDQLVFNSKLNEYEVGSFIDKTTPTNESIILDIGCGTSHDVNALAKEGYNVTGMDKSQAMVAKAHELYPSSNFMQGDALDSAQFAPQSFTHILSLYFTVYYMQDKSQFFTNVFNWLMPGGYFILHLVERDMFDPILPPSNPMLLLSPQRYAKERITHSKVTFNHFKYKANFEIDESEDKAKFIETIHFNEGGKRRNEHEFHMPSLDNMIQMVQDVGFLVKGKVDLIKAGYEYQYLYIFSRPA